MLVQLYVSIGNVSIWMTSYPSITRYAYRSERLELGFAEAVNVSSNGIRHVHRVFGRRAF